MGLRIHTNVASLGAQRNLEASSSRLHGNFSRLASGLRIATAADDASGLAISERMRARVTSLSSAARNIQDGISLTQIAEGALQEVSNALGRMKELAVRAQNGTISDSDRQNLDAEYLALGAEIQRITGSTDFNGIDLFTSNQTIEVQAGLEDGSTVAIDLTQLSTLGQVLQILSLSGPLGPDIPSSLVTSAIDTISDVRGELGASTNVLQSALASTLSAREQLASSESRIRDLDVASETANLTRASILQQASTAVLAQANANPTLALQLLG